MVEKPKPPTFSFGITGGPFLDGCESWVMFDSILFGGSTLAAFYGESILYGFSSLTSSYFLNFMKVF
jgi:hypothetical protein